jgi:hypothetical protein
VDERTEGPQTKRTYFTRLHVAGLLLTIFGIGLFSYFIYSVGLDDLTARVDRFGLVGFGLILGLHFFRVCARAFSWKLSVHEPYELAMRDTIPAVIMGEAMSSTIPLGILVSGTAKAVAVRNRIPLVAGLSSVATENLFYSFTTGIFLIVGALLLLGTFAADETLIITLYSLIGVLTFLIIAGVVMVVRQWHFASAIVNWLYKKGFLKKWLEHIRFEVRRFEDLIYGFYRHYPRRFVPICLILAGYHLVGVFEVWIILKRLTDGFPNLLNAFLLESISRLIAILFKLVPLMIGIDEAGAQFLGRTLALASGVGITLAIIRKGRILFWTSIGILLIIKRGLSLSEITGHHEETTIAGQA